MAIKKNNPYSKNPYPYLSSNYQSDYTICIQLDIVGFDRFLERIVSVTVEFLGLP